MALSTVPSLRRESTRTLCDQFTTLFETDCLSVPHSALPPSRIVSAFSSSLSSLSSALSSAQPQAQAQVQAQAHLRSSNDSLDISLSLSLSTSTMAMGSSQEAASSESVSTESVASQSVVSSTLPSPSMTISTVFTPASTPCSESDDSSAMLDTLSPPASPWFPTITLANVLMSSEKGTINHNDSKNNSNSNNNYNNNSDKHSNSSLNYLQQQDHSLIYSDSNTTNGDHLDFFNNSFYQSLPELRHYSQRSHPYYSAPQQHIHYHPHHRSSRPSPISVVAVRSLHSAQEEPATATTTVPKTASPSDLYNVTIDEILSAEPLNLDDLDLTEDDLMEDDPVVALPSSSFATAISPEKVSGNMVTKASYLANDDDDSEDLESSDEEEQEKSYQDEGTDDHPLQHYRRHHDEEDSIRYGDSATRTSSRKRIKRHHFEDSAPLSFSSAVSATTPQVSSPPSSGTRRSNGRSSILKAPRVRKERAKKSPKVYPQRRSKVVKVPEGGGTGVEKEALLTVASSIGASLSSDPGAISLSALTHSTGISTSASDKHSRSNHHNSNNNNMRNSSSKPQASTAEATSVSTSATIVIDRDGSHRCGLCPLERFGRVHDLKRHQISKHNEKTWPCDFCHRPFVRRDALLRHYAVKAARKDGIHPTSEESHRLSEARARAKLT